MGKRLIHIGMDGMNLLLLRKFLEEINLPNFSRLMEEGTCNRLLPSIPAWTPTNWAAQVTGAEPGSHGLAGWERRRKTQPWDAYRIQSWEFKDWKAETIWEVAEEAGYRCMITYFPVATWPSPVENGYVVAPGFREPPLLIADRMEYICFIEGSEQLNYHKNDMGDRKKTVDEAEEGLPPGTSVLELSPALDWRDAPDRSWSSVLPLPLRKGRTDCSLHLLVTCSESGEFERFLICDRKDLDSCLVELRLGEWTSFMLQSFKEGPEIKKGSFRFYLLSRSPDRGDFVFCRSQVYPVRGFTYPTGLGEELYKGIGPFIGRYTVKPTSDSRLDAFIKEMKYQGLWIAKAARYVLEYYGWDLHFCHWHIFDNINHETVNLLDTDGPDYDPDIGEWNMEAQRRCYRIADKVLGEFLDLRDPDTYILVSSDHAMPPAHRWCDVDILLEKKGLIKFKYGTREIDFARSKAYTLATRGSEIFVNLEGREPFGIVPPEKYEDIQEEVIDALLDWRDPLTKKRVIALALKLQDAQIIGFCGEEQGDVVFTYNRGYGWGSVYERGGKGEAIYKRPSIGPGEGALHGSQIPTSEKGLYTNMGCMIMTGPSIKAGYERDWKSYGLMREIDIAPTISYIMEMRPPSQNRGAILHDIFRNPLNS